MDMRIPEVSEVYVQYSEKYKSVLFTSEWRVLDTVILFDTELQTQQLKSIHPSYRLFVTNLEEKSEVFAKSYIMSHKQRIIDFDTKWCSSIIDHFFWQDKFRQRLGLSAQWENSHGKWFFDKMNEELVVHIIMCQRVVLIFGSSVVGPNK